MRASGVNVRAIELASKQIKALSAKCSYENRLLPTQNRLPCSKVLAKRSGGIDGHKTWRGEELT
jgi:hypothetical protein